MPLMTRHLLTAALDGADGRALALAYAGRISPNAMTTAAYRTPRVMTAMPEQMFQRHIAQGGTSLTPVAAKCKMKKKRKGQSAIEFLFSVGVVFFIFIILLFITFNKTTEVRDLQRVLDKKAECQKIANFMNGVFMNSEGSYATITTKFEVTIGPKLISVKKPNRTWEGEMTCRHLAHVDNTNFTGSAVIRKQGSRVVIDVG